ncbi:MAG: EamA family transporter [Lachnospiraceae bacterium]|nr:EamA family transporter [Lachnospiraceae bacterium]
MKKLAPFLVLLSGCLWGSMGLFVRHLTNAGLSSLDIVGVRALSTVILMGILLLIKDRSLFRIKWKDIWCFIGTGICSILLFNFCYFTAIQITSLSVAAVLLYTAPAFVMLMSYVLFKEKLTGNKVLALGMTLLGCVLVTGMVGSDSTNALSGYGILVGIGAGFGYALYSIFSRYALERGYSSLQITFYTFVFATIGIMPMASMQGILRYIGSNVENIGFTLIFGAVSTVLPYLAYTAGLNYVENGQASIIASVEPVVATLFGVVLFREKMSFGNIVGMLLVLGAIVLCNIKMPHKAKGKAIGVLELEK